MKKSLLYLMIILTLVNLTALGTMIYQRRVDSGCNLRTERRASRFEKIRRDLGLTPAQTSRFEEIRFEFHSQVDSLNHALEGMRTGLLEQIWLPQPENARIDSLLNQISQVQAASQRLVIWHFYQFREVLTPEQWQKFYGIVAKRSANPGKIPCTRPAAQTKEDNR